MQDEKNFVAIAPAVPNHAWRLYPAKISIPKNLPKKPSKTRVPTNERESKINFFCSDRACCFERCAAPTLCESFRTEKFAEKTLQNNRADEEKRIQEKKIFTAIAPAASNAAWRQCFAKLTAPKNLPKKPSQTKVPTNKRESKRRKFIQRSRLLRRTLCDANASQKFPCRKICRRKLAKQKFRPTSANPGVENFHARRLVPFRRCVAPTRSKTSRAEKFAEETLQNKSSDEQE